jgi:hypothetical protein
LPVPEICRLRRFFTLRNWDHGPIPSQLHRAGGPREFGLLEHGQMEGM